MIEQDNDSLCSIAGWMVIDQTKIVNIFLKGCVLVWDYMQLW